MGGAQEAVTAADAFLHAVITLGTFAWSSLMVVLGLLIALHRMIGLSLHVCVACLVACLCWRFRQRRISLLETLDVTMPQVWVLHRCGDGVWVPWCGDTRSPRLEYALGSMFCTPSQHHAIGLQTDCMVTVLAPWLRLLDSHVYALWP